MRAILINMSHYFKESMKTGRTEFIYRLIHKAKQFQLNYFCTAKSRKQDAIHVGPEDHGYTCPKHIIKYSTNIKGYAQTISVDNYPDCTFSCAGKCVGENNGSTIDSIVLAKVVRGRSSRETTRNADWITT